MRIKSEKIWKKNGQARQTIKNNKLKFSNENHPSTSDSQKVIIAKPIRELIHTHSCELYRFIMTISTLVFFAPT